MNFYSHDYLAHKVLNRYNPLIAAGSHIPDFVPFVSNSVFTFEEIHESPDILYDYLKKNNPEKIDLALAMMSHSVKFGADKFNNIHDWLIKDEKRKSEIIDDIMDCSGVSYELASGSRFHNYLWIGADIYLLENNIDFVNQIKNSHRNIDREEISGILSQCFAKDKNEVLRMTNYLFDHLDNNLFDGLDGYTKTWKDFIEGVGQGDKIDIEKSKILFMKIYKMFEEDWENVFEKVIKDVSIRMNKYL